MAVFLSLPPKQIGTTAKNKGYQVLSEKFLMPLIKDLPEKSSMIGDKNWNPSDKFWTIKVSAKNLRYITKDKKSPFTLINGKMGKGEAVYTVPDKKPIGIKFTTVNQSKTNTADQERGSSFISSQEFQTALSCMALLKTHADPNSCILVKVDSEISLLVFAIICLGSNG